LGVRKEGPTEESHLEKGKRGSGGFQEMVAYHTLKKETTVKKTMKWKLGVVLSLALLVGFAALDVRPSWAVGTDVFDRDSRLYVPYWRVDPNIDTILIIENPDGPTSTYVTRFYDKDCKFVRDLHNPLTTADVDFIDVGAIMSPLTLTSPREGGLIITTDATLGGSGGAALTAETLVVDGVNGSVMRFHHINENDAGAWTTFENTWTGAYFDASFVDNEVFLFCPGYGGATTTDPRRTKMAVDLFALANSPVNAADTWSRSVDILVYDDEEDLLISIPVPCACVTRHLLHNLTTFVVGGPGRIEITSDPAFGGDNEDFIAYMRRQVRGSQFYVNGYMFSN